MVSREFVASLTEYLVLSKLRRRTSCAKTRKKIVIRKILEFEMWKLNWSQKPTNNKCLWVWKLRIFWSFVCESFWYHQLIAWTWALRAFKGNRKDHKNLFPTKTKAKCKNTWYTSIISFANWRSFAFPHIFFETFSHFIISINI